ncbi:LppU/SCO3897 family protein [Actinokineospora terrae]|uniref:Uncharacterized protein n=1 Tax=Actinokineospora terrae TaxID=155974 RepID=A0A1H9UF62_9PSEU|nr:hypothetical protein [Actinokineospora terrae]SES08002.1 hypothetical protein SAMN04487818_107196 [Actinokineospora terrae]
MTKPEEPDTPAEQPVAESADRLDFLDGHVEPAGPRRHKLLPLWAVALIAVLITGIGFVVFRYVLADDPAAIECASVTGSGDSAKVAVVGCGDAAAFRIASRKDLSAPGCAEGAYREMRTEKELLCLMPNFVKGNCYVPDEPNQAFKVGSCESSDAIKVVDELRDTSDPSPCPNGNGLGYPEPPIVFCLETPNTTGS